MMLVRAIVDDNDTVARRMLASSPQLANERAIGDVLFAEITHYMYGGDTALHIAAAAYRAEVVAALLAAGAGVSATNRRGAQPLHYAADGVPGAHSWNPRAQVATITALIEGGGDPNAADKSGVAPLHRAVRTRCAAAVRALLAGGADPHRPNSKGSTPLDLATRTTGRGGSGSPEARAEQAQILHILQHHGAAR